jgi:hypothetical protein
MPGYIVTPSQSRAIQSWSGIFRSELSGFLGIWAQSTPRAPTPEYCKRLASYWHFVLQDKPDGWPLL